VGEAAFGDVVIGVLIVLVIAILAIGFGVWFGLCMAPPIGRRVDRQNEDEEEPGDRPD
jgi:hypothetical protein